MAAALEKEIPKALVYSTLRSSLLVVGGSKSWKHATKYVNEEEETTKLSADNINANLEQDAKKIHETFIKGARFINEHQTQLILTSSSECNKDNVMKTLKRLASQASGEDGLFMFVYTGGACDKVDYGIGFDTSEGDDFVEVTLDHTLERYSLMLDQYDCNNPQTSLLGSEIGKAIQEGKPEQVLLILECPHSKEIAVNLRESLSACNCLEITVPLGINRAPYYTQSLDCSAFAYFLNLIVGRTEYTAGMFPLKTVLGQVEKCCQALSLLDMVQDGDWVKTNATIPEAKFMEIPEKVGKILDIDEDDCNQTDGTQKFQKLAETFRLWLKTAFTRKSSKPCPRAKHWTHAATEVCLKVLQKENVLEGAVLEAAVGSIVASIVTIQKSEGCILSASFFGQAYILAVAAVNFVAPNNPDLEKHSLVTSAAAYYLRANGECPTQDKQAIEQLIEKLQTDA